MAIAILAAIVILPWVVLREQVTQVFNRGRQAVMGVQSCALPGDNIAPGPVSRAERVQRMRNVLTAHFQESSSHLIQRVSGSLSTVAVIHPRQFLPGGVQTWVNVLMTERPQEWLEITRRSYKEQSELMLSGKEIRTLPLGPKERGEDTQLGKGECVRLDSGKGGAWEGIVAVRDPGSPSRLPEPHTALYSIGVAYGIFMCSDVHVSVWQMRASDRASRDFGSKEEMRTWATRANAQAKAEVVGLMQRLAPGVVAQRVCTS